MNISQIAQLTQQPSQQLETGWVQEITNNGYVIRLANTSTLIAQKSYGCTLVPEKDDLVMLVRTQEAGCFVLTILQRKSECTARMSFDNGLEINTPQSVKIQSNELALANLKTQMLTQNMDIASSNIQVNAESTRFQSRTVESVSERMVQKVKDSFKIIERLEQVSARDVIQNIKNAFLQRSKQVDISAKQDVKINGDRIHMG